MKKASVFILKIALSVILLLLVADVSAQPILGTLSSFTYTSPGGAYVASGTTATVPAGVTVQFDEGLRIEPGGILYVSGTIKMNTDQLITMQQSPVLGTGARLYMYNGSKITSVTTNPLNGIGLWGGIICTGNPSLFGVNEMALLQMDGGTIEYAHCAYTCYDPGLGSNWGFGRLHAKNATFQNNIRSIDAAPGVYVPGSSEDEILWIGNYAENCLFRLTSDFSPGVIPADMIRAWGTGFIFHSCNFIAEFYAGAVTNGFNFDYVGNTTAIDANISIIWLEQQLGSANGCQMSGLKNGLVVNNSYPFTTIVSNSQFSCVHAISIDGNYNPMIYRNDIQGPITALATAPWVAPDYSGIFIRNCQRFRVEENNIQYDHSADAHCYGIVAMNNGDGDNIIYRNSVQVLTPGVGIESIGTNRSSDGTSGLKIMCNFLNSPIDWNASFNVAVMQDVVSNPVNGIHDEQYDVNRSAGNVFQSNIGNPYSSYYLESGTNNMSAFSYKYDPLTSSEQPLYHNIVNLLNTGTANVCPPNITRDPQPSIAAFPGKEGRAVPTWSRDGGRAQQRPFSGLSPADVQAISDMENIQKWLSTNHNNWRAMPQNMKQQVYNAELIDQGQGGSRARMLLHYYEGRKYEPVVLLPVSKSGLSLPVANVKTSVYPNPAHDKVTVEWEGTTALLHIINAQGQACLSQTIEKGHTTLNISRLRAGTYIIQIQDSGNHSYNQKLTVK